MAFAALLGVAGSPAITAAPADLPMAAPLDWPQEMIGATSASGLDGSGVVVAVLDSGFDHTHPDLAGKDWQNPKDPPNGLDDDLDGHADDSNGWDFCHDAPPRSVPGFGHGTFVAGVLAADGGQGGVRGVAPGVRLMDVQVYCDNDRFPAPNGPLARDALREGLRYAIDHGADIIVMSLQLWTDQPPGAVAALLPDPEEFQAAHDAGIVLVGAAGNQGVEGAGEPGGAPHVLTVGATTGCGFRHGFSNFGAGVDLWAPGRAYAPLLGGGHAWVAGTSFAAPLVAGAAALLLQKDPGMAPDDLQGRLVAAAAPSEDGPVIDLHGLLGVLRPGGTASLILHGSTHVMPPEFLQYVVSGATPALLQLHSEGQGDWCINLADSGNDTFSVAPTPKEAIPIAARAVGATWAGPWLNETFTYDAKSQATHVRPVAVVAATPGSSASAPAPLPVIVMLGIVAAAAWRRPRRSGRGRR